MRIGEFWEAGSSLPSAIQITEKAGCDLPHCKRYRAMWLTYGDLCVISLGFAGCRVPGRTETPMSKQGPYATNIFLRSGLCPNLPLPGYMRCHVQTLYSTLLRVLARVTLIGSWEFPL